MNTHLSFACDYMEGTHPAILQKLVETNLEKTGGYGLDPYCDAAKEKIKAACGCPARFLRCSSGVSAGRGASGSALPR